MSNSLAQLDDNLHNDSFKYTGQTFTKDRQFQLMKQKGVYLYDYMDNSERFKETQLPPKKAFYSILNNEHITDAEYKHAQNVWKTFKLINMGVYRDLYLASDVLLLADVFQNFRTEA